MNRHVLHRRHDDPFDVSAGIAGVVHGRVPAVLRVVLVAVLGTPTYVVEMLAIRVDELDRGAVAVNVDDGPERAPGLDAAEEETLLLAIDAKVHVAGRRDVVEQYRVSLREPLGERLSPVPWLVRQVRTRVPRQTASQIDRIVAGEAETDHAAPVVGNLQELDADLCRFTEKRPCRTQLARLARGKEKKAVLRNGAAARAILKWSFIRGIFRN